jgi:hypothetical protein
MQMKSLSVPDAPLPEGHSSVHMKNAPIEFSKVAVNLTHLYEMASGISKRRSFLPVMGNPESQDGTLWPFVSENVSVLDYEKITSVHFVGCALVHLIQFARPPKLHLLHLCHSARSFACSRLQILQNFSYFASPRVTWFPRAISLSEKVYVAGTLLFVIALMTHESPFDIG